MANKLDMQPEECIVFEDALNGIKAAKSGNMKAVLILGEHNSDLEFEGLPDIEIKDFSEISLEKLRKLFS